MHISFVVCTVNLLSFLTYSADEIIDNKTSYDKISNSKRSCDYLWVEIDIE